MRVIGIETSCDETAVALIDNGRILASRVATQEIHARWGGVVPEIASRLHQKTLARMVHETLQDAGWTFDTLEGVAATRGPGLIGALLVGVGYAKGLSVGLNIPFAGVNHLEGHLWSASAAGTPPPLPALALLVSGGHTELIRIDDFGKYTYLGMTLDDAVGEAFDKVGGLLGIPYPAGAALSRLAGEGNPSAIAFPVPDPGNAFAFSYAGLKTAVLRYVQKQPQPLDDPARADIAASFEMAAVTQLVLRLDRALQNDWYRSVILAGGVAANRLLRSKAAGVATRHGVELFVPPIELCTDNAAMIAWVGEKRLVEYGGDPLTLETDPNLGLLANGEIA